MDLLKEIKNIQKYDYDESSSWGGFIEHKDGDYIKSDDLNEIICKYEKHIENNIKTNNNFIEVFEMPYTSNSTNR